MNLKIKRSGAQLDESPLVRVLEKFLINFVMVFDLKMLFEFLLASDCSLWLSPSQFEAVDAARKGFFLNDGDNCSIKLPLCDRLLSFSCS